MRVLVDGKHFQRGGQRFAFRGVSYGTFAPRESDGALFPERSQAKRDLSAMHEAGFTVLRTYTPPTSDLIELAADWDLQVFPGVFWPDWRYLVGASRRAVRAMVRDARAEVRAVARSLNAADNVLGLSLGNEVPADVVRWMGTGHVAGVIDELVEVVREEDPDRLVTYATYPTAEYLPLPSVDFLTFNLFLEDRLSFRRYLTRLHHLAGDRPLVLGEMGLNAGDDAAGEEAQARVLDWQLRTVLDRGVAGSCIFSWTDEWSVGGRAVEGWSFGLTRADRSPRPALEVAVRWNARTVADLRDDWPSMSVVVCAYNAEATLDQCLRHTVALDYPGLEVVVVDDGSTDATVEIARRHEGARVVTIDHGGLSTARNEGMRQAQGQIVAYLDSDAYPTPEWPYYLALAFDGRRVMAAGGPNVPPLDDPAGAQVVARSPGGPVHVLTADDRAEHVPGCNLALWRYALHEVGGFDPVYLAAGDDVDLCWKVLDRGGEIGFHPAALVWHHRRPGLRTYLRQQRGYGRAEAIVEARHPDRFTPIGTARWRGRIYNSLLPAPRRQRVYRGPWGTAAFQSVYRSGGHGLDVAHQVGVPLAVAGVLTAPLGMLAALLFLPALAALMALLALAAIDVAVASPPRALRRGRLRFRLAVATHHLLQPLVRWWGRWRAGADAHGDGMGPVRLAGPVRRSAGGALLLPEDGPREEVAAAIVACLRRARLRTVRASEWDDFDAHIDASLLVRGELVTSNHPPGTVQLRVRRRIRPGRAVAVAAAVAAVGLIEAGQLGPGEGLVRLSMLEWDQAYRPLAGLVGTVAMGDLLRGWWRTGPGLRRALVDAVR